MNLDTRLPIIGITCFFNCAGICIMAASSVPLPITTFLQHILYSVSKNAPINILFIPCFISNTQNLISHIKHTYSNIKIMLVLKFWISKYGEMLLRMHQLSDWFFAFLRKYFITVFFLQLSVVTTILMTTQRAMWQH